MTKDIEISTEDIENSLNWLRKSLQPPSARYIVSIDGKQFRSKSGKTAWNSKSAAINALHYHFTDYKCEHKKKVKLVNVLIENGSIQIFFVKNCNVGQLII